MSRLSPRTPPSLRTRATPRPPRPTLPCFRGSLTLTRRADLKRGEAAQSAGAQGAELGRGACAGPGAPRALWSSAASGGGGGGGGGGGWRSLLCACARCRAAPPRPGFASVHSRLLAFGRTCAEAAAVAGAREREARCWAAVSAAPLGAVGQAGVAQRLRRGAGGPRRVQDARSLRWASPMGAVCVPARLGPKPSSCCPFDRIAFRRFHDLRLILM